MAGKLCGVFHTLPPHLLAQHSGGSEDSCLCSQHGALVPSFGGSRTALILTVL